jgi:hypothetical protein
MFKKIILVLAAACPLAAQAGPAYSISYIDPLNQAAAYRAQIDAHLGAAFDAWSSRVNGSGSIEIEVRITDIQPYASGASATSGYFGENANGSVWQQGMAHEWRTGEDPNGSDADVIVAINPHYLANELWFDPDPLARTAPVAANRTDAMSVFIHELGHALAFNGWGSHSTGQPPIGYGSTWDQHVRYSDGNIYFHGPQAMSVYGAPVPLTTGNNFHLGNAPGSGRPGADLVGDLFNGWVFYHGARYGITALDLAIVADTGLQLRDPASVPEPGAQALLLLGLAGMAGVLKRRR